MKYGQVYDGEKVSPRMRGYKMMCCGCGLVHVFDFFVVKRGKGLAVEFTIREDRRATAAARRRKKRNL